MNDIEKHTDVGIMEYSTAYDADEKRGTAVVAKRKHTMCFGATALVLLIQLDNGLCTGWVTADKTENQSTGAGIVQVKESGRNRRKKEAFFVLTSDEKMPAAICPVPCSSFQFRSARSDCNVSGSL